MSYHPMEGLTTVPLEDIYDLLVTLVHALGRNGALSEAIQRDALALIEKADPKIEAKRQAHAEAAAKADADYAEFQAFQAFKAAGGRVAAPEQPAVPAVPAVPSVPAVPVG